MSLARPFLAAAFSTLAAGSALAAAPPPAHASRVETAGGVQWTVPARWTAGNGSSMRVATYGVPAAKGAEPGECAVFYFGAGQGGTVEANVERWGKQFEGAPSPTPTTTTVAGLRITRAAVSGTYLAPGGPMMQSTGKRPGYRLLGAIAEGPEGNVFFKLTGPAATVAAAGPEFEALVASLRKK
jgi:hypothetical protein